MMREWKRGLTTKATMEHEGRKKIERVRASIECKEETKQV
jgi:hypothetical protein